MVMATAGPWIAAAQTAPPRPSAPVVRAVTVQPAPGRSAASYAPLIEQKAGQPLNGALVGRTIARLFATGEFADIRAVEYPAPGGVRLVFQTQPNYFIGAVRVTNPPKPATYSELVEATGLTLGHIFTAPAVREAVETLAHRPRGQG